MTRTHTMKISIASPEGLPRNEVCTWLLGAPCYGNAFFAFVEPTEMNDVSTRTLMQVIAGAPLSLYSYLQINLFLSNRYLFHSSYASRTALAKQRRLVSSRPHSKQEVPYWKLPQFRY